MIPEERVTIKNECWKVSCQLCTPQAKRGKVRQSGRRPLVLTITWKQK